MASRSAIEVESERESRRTPPPSTRARQLVVRQSPDEPHGVIDAE